MKKRIETRWEKQSKRVFFFFNAIFPKKDGNGSKWIASNQARSEIGKKWQVVSFQDKGQPFPRKRDKEPW